MPSDQRNGSPAARARTSCCALRRSTVPIPGSPAISSATSGAVSCRCRAAESYLSSVSHDDAATTVVGALLARAGTYNVVDDEPMRRCAFVDSLAGVLGVGAPRLAPPWTKHLFGSLGGMLARSVRVSNRKLREECAWVPKYPSMREGWRAVAVAIPPGGVARLAARRR